MNKCVDLCYKNNTLLLVIPQDWHNTIDVQELCQRNYRFFPPNVVKKVGKRYIICKSLEISNENTESSVEKSSKKCEINARLVFEYIAFGEVDSKESLCIDFQHSVFKERVYFTNCEFNGNVFFNHAVFHKYADFHESIFSGIVSFYNVTFKSAPNFSTCVFTNLQGTNFINVKMDSLDFDKVKDFIDEYENDSTYIDEKNKINDSKDIITNHKIRYASNVRDSFRTIKNVLIANNNLLDASNWHKLELYAKELELRLPEPESINSQNNKYKKCIDLIQLCFYRHTSEHHTDLLKILSWFVILVGSFAVTLFISKYLCILLYVFVSFVAIPALTIIAYKKDFFGIWTFINVLFFLALLAWNPKYIFGVANLFGNDKYHNDWFANLILSLYSILFVLVIFSLQKTARKNSIIPN